MTFHLCPKISDLPNRSAPGWNFEIANETPADAPARESLLDAALGPARRLKTSERLREGNAPAPGLALVARDPDGALIGSLRLWPIFAGGDRPALLLGPLAVDAQMRSHGVGGGLMREALRRAVADGHRAVLLVGDAPYYGRFGFKSSYTRLLTLPGPVTRDRFLGCELIPGALTGAQGRVRAAIGLRPSSTAMQAAA